jgi:hypothetical protein
MVMLRNQFRLTYLCHSENTSRFPVDIPLPLGKYVTLTHYVDANLYHDMVTRRVMTRRLHLINKMLVDWYLKNQATMETATYGWSLLQRVLLLTKSST